jgi:hypothetical protein
MKIINPLHISQILELFHFFGFSLFPHMHIYSLSSSDLMTHLLILLKQEFSSCIIMQTTLLGDSIYTILSTTHATLFTNSPNNICFSFLF